MKKYLAVITMLLALGLSAGAASQSHRHTPRTAQADTTRNSQDAIEAYSDTTSAAMPSADSDWQEDQSTDNSDKDRIDAFFESLDSNDFAEMMFVLCVLAIIFVLSPIGIIIAIAYFLLRNRREKYKLAQMAMQNGQPIPDKLLDERKSGNNGDTYQTGIRQVCLGVGLMFFLGYTAGKIGVGIGLLVFFIGLGKIIIAKTAERKVSNVNDGNNDNNINNDLNIQHYE